MKLLLHVCCAPCSAAAISRIRDFSQAAAFYYNPNIQPEAEYSLRLAEFRRYAALEDMEILEGPYEPESWFKAVEGMEDEKEGGARCEICFRLRLEETARKAKSLSVEHIATTLTAGPDKKADSINRIGEETAGKYGLAFLKEDFKKKDGFKKSLETCREFNIYRQHYCGCSFSKKQGTKRRGNNRCAE